MRGRPHLIHLVWISLVHGGHWRHWWHWGSLAIEGTHRIQVEIVEIVGKDDIGDGHDLGCPVGGKHRRHGVEGDNREDNLSKARCFTMGMPDPITFEQHSQEMLWLSRMFRLYCEDRSFPEQVGLISGLLGIGKF